MKLPKGSAQLFQVETSAFGLEGWANWKPYHSDMTSDEDDDEKEKKNEEDKMYFPSPQVSNDF